MIEGMISDHVVPEIVRIGVGNARIKCVTRQRVEYLDEAGQECFVDLEECARNWVQSHDEDDEDDFVVLTSEDRRRREATLRRERAVS